MNSMAKRIPNNSAKKIEPKLNISNFGTIDTGEPKDKSNENSAENEKEVSSFDPYNSINLNQQKRMKLNEKFLFDEKEWSKSFYQNKRITDRDSLYSVCIPDASTNLLYNQIFSPKYPPLSYSFIQLKNNPNTKDDLLFFDCSNSKRIIVMRTWQNNRMQNTKISKDDAKKWILNQVQNFNKMKIAGTNSYIYSPKDFYIVFNESESFYFVDFLFEVDGINISEVQSCTFTEFQYMIFETILKTSLLLQTGGLFLKVIRAIDIYINNISSNLELGILPFLIEACPSKDKENISILSQITNNFKSKQIQLNEIYCTFDDFMNLKLKEFILSIQEKLDNLINPSIHGNQLNQGSRCNGKELSYKIHSPFKKYSKLSEGKEKINQMYNIIDKRNKISLPDFQTFFEIIERNGIKLINSPLEVHPINLLNQLKIESQKSGYFTSRPSPSPADRNTFSEYLLNSQREEAKRKNRQSSPEKMKSELKNKEKNFSRQNSIHQESVFFDDILKLFGSTVESVKSNECDLHNLIIRLANLMVTYTLKQIEKTKIPILDKILDQNMKELKRKFSNLKEIVDNLEREQEYILKTEIKSAKNSKKSCKTIYLADSLTNPFKNKFCIIVDPNGGIYLGEYDLKNDQTISSGFGLSVKLNSDEDNNRIYLGKFSDNMKNGFGFEPIDSKCFIGYYKNNMKNGIGIFIDSNEKYHGGIYNEGQLTNDQIMGDPNYYYRGNAKKGKKHGKGVITWRNGESYEGDFFEEKIEGQGILKMANDQYLEGIFNDGEFVEGFGIKQSYDENIYKGHFQYGVFNGEGTMSYANGEIYTGNFVNGKKEGKGTHTFPHYGYYEGYWKNDEPHGFGKRLISETNYYEGNYIEGLYHGIGKLVNNNGESYDGNWNMGKKSGKGAFTSSTGERYEGDFKDNEFHGHGTFICKEYTYDGDWENGKKNGEGTLTNILNHAVYKGHLKDDYFQGLGEYTNERNDKYAGNFEQGKKSGKGLYTKANGEKYDGDFLDDQYHGYGTYYYPSGDSFKGKWVFGSREDIGIYSHASGITLEVDYKNNIISGNVTIIYPNPLKTFYKSKVEGKTEIEIIMQFINIDLDRYTMKEKPSLNGYYEILYSNGDLLQGTFENGLLMEGIAKIIIRDEQMKPGENIYKHVNILNNSNFPNPCRYDGRIINGQLNGSGILIYLNLQRFYSLYNAKTHFDTVSEIQDLLDNQISFNVIWENNSIKEASKMLIISSDNKLYYGEISNDKYNGIGKLYYPNGDYRKGQFFGGLFVNGHLRKSLAGNKVFIGEIIKGIPGGRGILTTPEYIYEGDVNKDFLMHGKGKRTYTSFEKYRHFLINSSRLSELETFFLKNHSFEGTFENDEIAKGDGVLVFVNEGIYNGTIENKTRTGLGSMYYENGDSYSGLWKANVYHGNGEFTSHTLNRFKGSWVEGELPGIPNSLLRSRLQIRPLKH